MAISARKYDWTLSVVEFVVEGMLAGGDANTGDPASISNCQVVRLSGRGIASLRLRIPLLATLNWTRSSLREDLACEKMGQAGLGGYPYLSSNRITQYARLKALCASFSSSSKL
jgi:hypothetical protein